MKKISFVIFLSIIFLHSTIPQTKKVKYDGGNILIKNKIGIIGHIDSISKQYKIDSLVYYEEKEK